MLSTTQAILINTFWEQNTSRCKSRTHMQTKTVGRQTNERTNGGEGRAKDKRMQKSLNSRRKLIRAIYRQSIHQSTHSNFRYMYMEWMCVSFVLCECDVYFVWPSIIVITWWRRRLDHLYFIHLSLLSPSLSLFSYYCVPILDSIMGTHIHFHFSENKQRWQIRDVQTDS